MALAASSRSTSTFPATRLIPSRSWMGCCDCSAGWKAGRKQWSSPNATSGRHRSHTNPKRQRGLPRVTRGGKRPLAGASGWYRR